MNNGVNFYAPPGFSVSNIATKRQTNGLWGAGAAVRKAHPPPSVGLRLPSSHVGFHHTIAPGYSSCSQHCTAGVPPIRQGGGSPPVYRKRDFEHLRILQNLNGATSNSRSSDTGRLSLRLLARRQTPGNHTGRSPIRQLREALDIPSWPPTLSGPLRLVPLMPPPAYVSLLANTAGAGMVSCHWRVIRPESSGARVWRFPLVDTPSWQACN